MWRLAQAGITVNNNTTSEFDKPGKVIFGAIQGFGIGVSVIAVVVIGIKFMIGSAEEKAEYKAHIFPYIMGVVFVAGAASIPSIIYNWLN